VALSIETPKSDSQPSSISNLSSITPPIEDSSLTQKSSLSPREVQEEEEYDEEEYYDEEEKKEEEEEQEESEEEERSMFEGTDGSKSFRIDRISKEYRLRVDDVGDKPPLAIQIKLLEHLMERIEVGKIKRHRVHTSECLRFSDIREVFLAL
jgi:hypothetical protein